MPENKTFPFTIRVYGVLIHEDNLLIAEEKWFDTRMVKLPGGGLEYGESPEECLRREFMEECNIEIDKPILLFTPETFIAAKFYENTQVVPLYYKVSTKEIAKIKVQNEFKEEQTMKNGELNLHWVELSKIHDYFFSFPGDREMWAFFKDQFIPL